MLRHSGKVRLSHFHVRVADGTEYSDALYANGHQQCEVIIEILKETRGKSGSWGNVALTDDERASINIVPVPRPGNRNDAIGWTCDKEKNDFDPGLWYRDGEDVVDNLPRRVVFDPRIESVSRYMRLNEGASLESQEFMATITLDGEDSVGSFSEAEADFNSSVVIAPAYPCALRITDLIPVVDYAALQNAVVDVDLYGWEGTNGLRFVENYGFDKLLDVINEGTHLQTSYAHQGWHKGGIFMGLSPEQPLRMDMIQQHINFPGPDKNPVVRRQFRGVMSAARLHSRMEFLPESDTQPIWRLRDNFGTLHRFKLISEEGGNRLSLEVVPSAVKLKTFQIKLPDGQDSTNALYANDRHQCKVEIEVVVEQEDMDDKWLPRRLTPEEKASITVTRYSANVDQTLPLGWSCDSEKNIYDAGLWNRTGQVEQEQSSASQQVLPVTNIEIVNRYMRVNSATAIEQWRFMARIVLGGKVYTTNFSEGSSSFHSWVSITPQKPYVLKVADLRQYYDGGAFYNGSTRTDIDVYYWSPPSGLSFVVNRGFDRPMWVRNEGAHFQSSFCQKLGKHYRKGGVVVSKDDPNLLLRLTDLHRNLPEHNANPFIRFDLVNTIMRAVWVSTTTAIEQGDVRTPWRLWDNFGCEHVFSMMEDWHFIVLRDYN